MNRPTTPRIVAAVASVAITFLLFRGVTSLSEPQATANAVPAPTTTAVAMALVAGPR